MSKLEDEVKKSLREKLGNQFVDRHEKEIDVIIGVALKEADKSLSFILKNEGENEYRKRI